MKTRPNGGCSTERHAATQWCRKAGVALGTLVGGLVLLFSGMAAGHVLWSSGVIFFQPNNWPYYECARSQAGISHYYPGGWPDGKAYVFAFDQNTGCVDPNVRPTGWLRASFDVHVIYNGTDYLCYAGSLAYSPAWQTNFGVGGIVCTDWGSGILVRTIATSGYYWDQYGVWKTGYSGSPNHSF